MVKTTAELLRKIDRRLAEQQGPDHSLSNVIQFQLQLVSMIEALLDEHQLKVRVDKSLLGTYHIDQTEWPHSSTGTVLPVRGADGQRLAIKLLAKVNRNGEILPSIDATYAFELPAVCLMTAFGERMMGTASNRSSEYHFYLGVAGVVFKSGQEMELVRLSIKDALNGEIQPAVVMPWMSGSLIDPLIRAIDQADQAGDVVKENGHAPIEEKTVRALVRQIIEASVPLPEELAKKIGSPDEVKALLTDKTIGWLTGRNETEPTIARAVEIARQVKALQEQFFGLPETRGMLEMRATGYIGKKKKRRLAQTFGPGDTKPSNVLESQANDDGESELGLFDPQWLILKEGVLGNEKPMFAPWPFADLMQVIAFTVTQLVVYGQQALAEAVKDELRQYYGPEHWGNWHELYFDMLVAYKLLVDVAYNIDGYLAKVQQGLPVPTPLRVIIERHAPAALELCQNALARYQEQGQHG